jgi:cobalt-zinc-cadmium efflux system protein
MSIKHEHDDDHDHDHHDDHEDHGHDHHHHAHFEPGDFSRAFAIGIGLNITFVVIEVVFGLMADSLALLADAGHNLSDVMTLILAWGASALAARRANARHTYGLRRGTVLASLFSSAMLLAAMGAIAWESVQRLQSPAPVEGWIMIGVAAVGVVINTATALLFASGREHDLNIKAAFLHMAGDAAVSAGVVLGGIGVLIGGWLWLDPVITLVIVVVIVIGTWDVFREALNLAFDAVPRGVDPDAVKSYLAAQPGVAAVHDLHIWGMSTTETALTAHVVMPGGGTDQLLRSMIDDLKRRFRIAHATIQVEKGDLQPACNPACQP